MRSWMKWTVAGGFGLLATSAIAADHTDGPAVQNDPAADLADVYAWSTNNNNSLALIQTVVGEFSPSVQYVFHVARSETDAGLLVSAPASWTNIVCEFESPTAIQCWVDDGSGTPVDYLTGDPSDDSGLTGVNGTFKVHAAQHADPFFFYLDGFAAAREYVQSIAAIGTDDGNGCPNNLTTPLASGNCIGETVAGLTRGLLNGDYADTNCTPGPADGDNPAPNSFETGNVWAIVAEIDKSAIAGDSAHEYLAVYASTHQKQ